mgnify:CR=1 FL=1
MGEVFDRAHAAGVLRALDRERYDVLPIGIAPDAIERLGAAEDDAVAARSRWVAAALAPAERTADWAAQRATFKDAAFAGTAVLHTADERTEALAIACALREAILDPQATAALVTPDRQLARRDLRRCAHAPRTGSDGMPRLTAPPAPPAAPPLGAAQEAACSRSQASPPRERRSRYWPGCGSAIR